MQGNYIYSNSTPLVSLSTSYGNAFSISGISRLSSITPSFTSPIATTSVSYVTIAIDTATCACNDRTGSINLTWTGTGIYNSSIPRGVITFNTAYSTAPKVFLQAHDSLAYASGSIQPNYYVKTTTTGFSIFSDQDAVASSTIKFFYSIEQ